MNTTIANNSGGNTNFQDQSTSGTATIVNNSGGTTTFGVAAGTDTASAGSAVIINNSGGYGVFRRDHCRQRDDHQQPRRHRAVRHFGRRERLFTTAGQFDDR